MLSFTVREIVPDDYPEVHRVRMSVRENRLVSGVVTREDYEEHILRIGKGWLAESRDGVVGFAIGNARTGNIWALFVEPGYEGEGIGRRLHAAMIEWLWAQGLERLWLTTDPGTRAERFYEKAGWIHAGPADHGEIRMELPRPAIAR